MTLGESLRRIGAAAAIAACCVAWTVVGASFWLDWSRPVQIGAIIAAALATELTFWLGAVLLGWTAFANRGQLWKRLTGGA